MVALSRIATCILYCMPGNLVLLRKLILSRWLCAADVVDGSPVLDIKPYLPFCESVSDAVVPEWVQVSVHITCKHTLQSLTWEPVDKACGLTRASA